jgi:REP-associated tyrosine transposase
MGRIPRTVLPDGVFHVYASGVSDSRAPFPTDEDKTTMFELFARLEVRFKVVIHVAVVMSTHYHGVLECLCQELSRAMHWLNWTYARGYNQKYELKGHVFCSRFQTRVIASEERFDRVCKYVLANPVKAGLCEAAADWPWSLSRYGFDLS